MSDDTPAPFQSQLPDGWQRFLAHVIEHGLAVKRRRPEDFIRHFPPSAIMGGLEDEPQRRANILVICTGVRMKIATKKSAGSSAEDLQIALDEDETDAETIVTLFDPDDRVLYLDPAKLWAYVTEGRFWEGEGSASSREHIAYMLRRALDDELITHREIVEGITTARIAELLPREELGNVLAAALGEAHRGKPFTEAKMLEMVPPGTLVDSIPLPDIWEKVIVPQIAARNGLVKSSVPEEPAPSEESEEVLLTSAEAVDSEEEDADLDMGIDDVLDMDDDD